MKHAKFIRFFICMNLIIIFFCAAALLQAQEEDLFLKQYSPDALIVLDLSGSMARNPSGGTNLYGNTECTGGTFYSSSQTGYTTVCSKLNIAKKVIFNVLDDTGNDTINNADKSSMNVRFGYMRFRNCSSSSQESGADYYSSSIDCSLPDLINCSGTDCSDGFCTVEIIGTGNRYASTSACTPDVISCRGSDCANGFCNTAKSTAVTYYAHSSCNTPSTYHCSSTDPADGCSDGFCNVSYTSTLTYGYASTTGCTRDTIRCRGAGCSGGFCSSPTTTTIYANNASCQPDNHNCGWSGWTDCSGGYCNSPHRRSGRSCEYACTRNCQVNCQPSCTTPCTAANTCAESCANPGCSNKCPPGGADAIDEGCNTLVWDLDKPFSCIQGKHETEWSTAIGACHSGAGECVKQTGDSGTGNSCVSGESATGGTHLAAALREAKMYLDIHKLADTDRECREKFVILISDGADTLACSGSGTETQTTQYKRRRESVARAKELADAGYKVFVIGFGSDMAARDRNTLNWMAYYGKTDNPNDSNSGSVTGTGAYVIPEGALYPSTISSCQNSATEAVSEGGSNWYYAEENDPGAHADVNDSDVTEYPLSGYAFFADDAQSLSEAIKSALLIIRESTQSFAQASVQLSRTEDENYLYEASFTPALNDPFWQGELKKFSICTAADVSAPTPPAGCVKVGDIKDNYDLEAGAVLKGRNESLRTIKTLISGSLTDFSTAIDPLYFGYTSAETSARNDVVGYIRGDAAYNPDQDSGNVNKLGDVFRSNPITVGTPAQFFNDSRDQYNPALSCNVSNPKTKTAFASYRESNCRAAGCAATADREKRLILAGANDGQLHAFKTSDMTEAWSFIPPNLLSKLKMITHKTHPTTLSHQYFVDGQIAVTDAWLPATADTGTCKSANDWRTLLILGEGRGTSPNTWCASSSCDLDFSQTYHSSNFPYYCGYHALDITNTLSPAYKWSIKGSGGVAIGTSHGPYFGDAWSKMETGRVKIYDGSSKVLEKWVGFIGAGYNEASCVLGTTCGVDCDCRGKGFFVIDLSNGRILWSFTLGASPATATKNPNMKYSLPATPALVDMDNDGFIDTAYIGDLGGNMWRFKFCKGSDASTCAISNWSGARIFDGTANISPVRPIFYTPSVTTDDYDNVWILWGTGDKNDSMKIPNPAYSEKFFALKDGKLTETSPTAYTINNLLNVTDTSVIYCNEIGTGCTAVSTENGWYINLDNRGEKVLADSLVFGRRVYYTSYMPEAVTGGACLATGESFLNSIAYTSGRGTFTENTRRISLGGGIASAPIVSILGGVTSMYVTTSDRGTEPIPINLPSLSSPTNVLFWRDHRVD